MNRLLIVLTALLVVFGASVLGPSLTPASFAQSANFCPPDEAPQFKLGFAEYRQQQGATVGEPVGCERYDSSGNGYQ